MNSNNRLLGALLLTCAVICPAGCSRDGIKDYEIAYQAFEQGYTSSDLATVENALIRFRGELIEMKRRNLKGIYWDYVLATVEARMCYFYSYIGREEESAHFCEQAALHLHNNAMAQGRDIVEVTREVLYRYVEHADSYLDVRWNKELHPP